MSTINGLINVNCLEFSRNKFYLDNCTTHHVCTDEQFFERIDYSAVDNFKTAGGLAKSHGTGVVSLIIKDKSTTKTFALSLTNVAYMPSAPMNLISIGKLQHQQGFYLNNRKQVLENGKQSIKVVELGELYYIEGRVKLGQINLQVRSEQRLTGQSVQKAVL